MKFGTRTPLRCASASLRAPVARYVRRSVKAPRGWGWATNPRRAAHNRVYHRVKFDPIAALRALFRT